MLDTRPFLRMKVADRMIPGWIDLQVNGLRGIDFSDPNLNAKQIERLSSALLERGVVAYCPTVISSTLDVYEHNLPLIAEASKSDRGARIIGIHLEGPFINPAEGARGIHNEKCIVLPSVELYERFRSLSHDKLSILTMAPEREGGLKLIKHVADQGKTVVSLGHHLAKREVISKAIEAGARAATHVGNGLPEMIHRYDNPVWSTLAEDRLTGLFITDGFHLPKEFVKICARSKGPARFIVTSDLVHLAGFPPGNYDFHGVQVVLEANGYLHRKGALQLAGSTCDMMSSMNYLASLGEFDKGELVEVGFENPLKLLALRKRDFQTANPPKIVYERQGFRMDTSSSLINE
jgi:N-acetylglucosamine-6-phosphate deacetylase